MEKTTFKRQSLLFVVSVVIFALVCLIAFWPQKEKLSSAKQLIKTSSSTQTDNKGDASMSGQLIIEDTLVGTGATVKAGDTVKIHYTGTLEDGTVFDSSLTRNEPFETQVGVGMLIQGWDQGIPGMKVGGKRHLVIPSELGYGNRAVGSIPANSTLIFDVELLDIL